VQVLVTHLEEMTVLLQERKAQLEVVSSNTILL